MSDVLIGALVAVAVMNTLTYADTRRSAPGFSFLFSLAAAVSWGAAVMLVMREVIR